MWIPSRYFLCCSSIVIVAVLYIYVTQRDIIILENQLLVANTTTIKKLNVPNETFDVNYDSGKTNDFWIGGLDCSYEIDGIYYSDMANSKLYALEKNCSKPRLVFSGPETWFPICLAVEDVTGKLYVGDLIQGGLTVHDLTSGDSSVILGTGILLCVAVAVDVDEKYVFVVDKYQILRLDLDGKNAKRIYELPDKMNLEFAGRRFRNGPQESRSYIGIDGMALDRKYKRVYRASGRSKTIESSDYSGGSRKIHFREVPAIFVEARSSSNSLAIIGDTVYWADPVERRIIKIIKSSDAYEIVCSEFEHATMASCEQRATTVDNPCAIDNGGCQQLCLLSRSHYNGYSCSCKFGYELDKEAKSCRPIRDFLLFLEGGAIKGLSLNEKPAFVFQPPGFRAEESSFLDFDAESGLIYYTDKVDGDEHKLHERRIDGKEKPKALSPNLFGRRVTNFAYDWTTKNLYYLSQYYSDAITLSVTNTRNPTCARVLVKNLLKDTATMRFFGPVVHPSKGYLYLAMIGGQSVRGEIKRMAMDGSDFKVIYKAGVKNRIGGFTLDYKEDRIYWSEVKESGSSYWQSSIKNSNLDGSDIREFDLTEDLEMAIGMTIHRGHIYGVDVGKRLFRMDIKDGKNVRILAESGHFAYNTKIYSRDVQPINRDGHPCQTHKCHKFCFAVPSQDLNRLKAVCGCPYGQKLANDGISCLDDLENQPSFKACGDKDSCTMRT